MVQYYRIENVYANLGTEIPFDRMGTLNIPASEEPDCHVADGTCQVGAISEEYRNKYQSIAERICNDHADCAGYICYVSAATAAGDPRYQWYLCWVFKAPVSFRDCPLLQDADGTFGIQFGMIKEGVTAHIYRSAGLPTTTRISTVAGRTPTVTPVTTDVSIQTSANLSSSQKSQQPVSPNAPSPATPTPVAPTTQDGKNVQIPTSETTSEVPVSQPSQPPTSTTSSTTGTFSNTSVSSQGGSGAPGAANINTVVLIVTLLVSAAILAVILGLVYWMKRRKRVAKREKMERTETAQMEMGSRTRKAVATVNLNGSMYRDSELDVGDGVRDEVTMHALQPMSIVWPTAPASEFVSETWGPSNESDKSSLLDDAEDLDRHDSVDRKNSKTTRPSSQAREASERSSPPDTNEPLHLPSLTSTLPPSPSGPIPDTQESSLFPSPNLSPDPPPAPTSSSLPTATQVYTWTPEQVALWLESMDVSPRLTALLREKEVDGTQMLGLTDVKLVELGVEQVVTREIVLHIVGLVVTGGVGAPPVYSQNLP
ncbi:hypothetical protein HDU97_005265 [Phlyctochytrium planicorne]|nr:hypothetical protein HDU97_005265 [Phlyctochytrium planicorne]